jgi:hypothetical protein
MNMARFHPVLYLLGTALAPCAFAAPTVTAPPAGSTVVHAGSDFATQVIGDAWDMNNPQDIDTDESTNLNNQIFSGGVFTGSPSACPAVFWPHFTGYGSQIVATKRGPRFPIDTTTYRYFTVKLKTATSQPVHMFFFKNGDTGVQANIGASTFLNTPANAWSIQTWDLYADTFGPGQGYQLWTTFPTVQGIRFDPCNTGTPAVSVDWIRLTAAPTAANMYTVTWTDTGSGPYTVTAIDGDNATYTFTTSASGTSYSADLSRLAPGDYHIAVSRSGASATSTGVLHVNIPAQVNITAPTLRGDQALSYAVQEQGGQWGPMSAVDFTPSPPPNFTNVSYTNPVGSFYGRPTNFDPIFIMKTTGHLIDTSYYRSACFTLQVFGTRDITNGSVARLFWGVNSSAVTTTKDIILGNGLVEYCMPDLADTTAVPLVSGSPQPWSGNLGYFRMDPHEFTPMGGCNTPQTCHDVRLDSIILAPFAAADPSYTIQWNLTDPDYVSGGSIQVLLDHDTTFGNGNETVLATLPYQTGAAQYAFNASNSSVASGTYRVVVLANDGINSVPQYATGPLVVASDVIFRDGFE